jgi:trans-2,3-dihydro-3-hydroxyanthranilate isomerase
MPTRTHSDEIPFFFVDVFSDRPLEGNPLTVVPRAENLSESTMIRIAREFNQSETTFLLPPTRPQADWRLRSFTPAGKEAFGVGHHTLGAWWWLAETGTLQLGDSGGRFTQEIGDRLLAVSIACNEGELVSVANSQASPEFGRICSDLAELAAALHISITDLGTDALPAQVVSPHLLVPIRNRAAIDKARPDFPRLGAILHALEGEGCYLFTLDTVLDGSIAHARFFNPTLGIAEDVATGSAAGPLACQLVAHHLAKDESTLQIEQGYAMGRPSLIRVHVSGNAVQISGRAFISGKGNLRVG